LPDIGGQPIGVLATNVYRLSWESMSDEGLGSATLTNRVRDLLPFCSVGTRPLVFKSVPGRDETWTVSSAHPDGFDDLANRLAW